MGLLKMAQDVSIVVACLDGLCSGEMPTPFLHPWQSCTHHRQERIRTSPYLILKFLLHSNLPFPSVASVFTVEILSFFKKIRLTASGIATLKDLIFV